MKVSIEKQWEDFVERLVAEGRCHSAEQVVSVGLSLVAQREAKLNKLRDVIEASIAAGGDMATKSWVLRWKLGSPTREPNANQILAPILPHSCARHRNPVTARRRGGRVFQPKDLGWLDACDKHRHEGHVLPRDTHPYCGSDSVIGIFKKKAAEPARRQLK